MTENTEPQNVFVQVISAVFAPFFAGDKIYNAVHGFFYGLNYPGRLFAQNVFYGVAFMGLVGLVLAGVGLYLGVGSEAPISIAVNKYQFFAPHYPTV